MNRDDPFQLPEGYGGVSGGDAPRRKTLAELEAELLAAAQGSTPPPQAAAASNPAPLRSSPPATSPRPPRFDLAAFWRRITGRGPLALPAPSVAGPGDFTATIERDVTGLPPTKWQWRWKWARRGFIAFSFFFIVLVGLLAVTAPLSQSLRPIVPPRLTLVSAEGQPIARNGAIVEDPVRVNRLPPHVIEAFLATEDRRFYSHWGIDPIGIGRALWNRVARGSNEGGSTITQQLAKFTFLNSDRTLGRKAREALIAVWMEAWLSKDEILSRYLSNAYFGDNVYGLRAASLHYFHRQPERLTLSQASMLAGLVKAPSRLAPTRNLARARARQRVVLVAMVDAGYLTQEEAHGVRPATIDHRATSTLPTGTYFADWAMPQARATVEEGYDEARIRTTLIARFQGIANRVTRTAPAGAQVALVAMRPNGEVVAMIGGRNYAASPFNRATQALRQPGSTFKIAVYLAALRHGYRPDSIVEDSPITDGAYRPTNYGGRYRGRISLREAFAQSSNVVAVRLYREVGGEEVRRAARDLGISTPIPDNASVALGSAGMSLIELTSAFAMVAGNYGPVDAHALHREEPGMFERLFDGRSALPSQVRADLQTLLAGVISDGTGRAARLAIPAFGKTGTTQDGRDALFVGFAGDLVVGVWVGRDDNRPISGLTGGGLPARIWRDFMIRAIPGAAPRAAPPPEPESGLPQIFDDIGAGIEAGIGGIIGKPEVSVDPDRGVGVDTRLGDVNVRLDGDGVRFDSPTNAQRTAAQRSRELQVDQQQAAQRRRALQRTQVQPQTRRQPSGQRSSPPSSSPIPQRRKQPDRDSGTVESVF